MTAAGPTMTPAEVERVAHEVRLVIQQRTCCPLHAGEVLMHVLAGFALDDASDNSHEAAATIMRGAREYAGRVRAGKFRVLRRQS